METPSIRPTCQLCACRCAESTEIVHQILIGGQVNALGVTGVIVLLPMRWSHVHYACTSLIRHMVGVYHRARPEIWKGEWVNNP